MNKNYNTKFAILKELQKPLVIQNLKINEPNNHQLLIEIKYSYICGSQLNEINGNKGHDKFLPHTLGHEASGVVLKIGKKVNNFKSGDKVILSWIKKKGKDSNNPYYLDKKNNIINSGQVSTFSKFSLVAKSRVYKIPKNLPMDIAALFGCAVPTGFGIIFKNIKNINKNEFVGIYGAGGVGIMAIIALKAMGIKNIYAIDKNKKNLNIAKKFGCKNAYTLDDFDKNIINFKINKKLIKYNFEISGNVKMMEMAIHNLSSDGICVLAGNIKHGHKIKFNPYDLIFGKRIYGFSGNDLSLEGNINKYFNIIKKLKLKKLRNIFTHYKFQNINSAIKDFKKGKILRPLIHFK